MLKKLIINDFALLKDVELNLNNGFTAITGETGSGKSLLVNAISFLIGGKCSIGVVRDGASVATVQGQFEFDHDESILLKRELSIDGKTKAYTNNLPTTLKKFTPMAQSLVDVTSQRAFSHLLNPENHLQLLDTFAGLRCEVDSLRGLFGKYLQLEKEIKRVAHSRDEYLQRQEIIDFKLNEIEKVDPQAGEDKSIISELHRLEHFEELTESGFQIENILIGSTNSVDGQLSEASTHLSKLIEIDKELTELSEDFESSRAVLKEIGLRVSQRCRVLQFDQNRLESLRQRQQRLVGLAKKYGGSIESVIEQRIKLLRQKAEGDNSATVLSELDERKEILLDKLSSLAEKISEVRQKLALKLEAKVKNSLSQLGMKGAMFEVRIERMEDSRGLYVKTDKRYKLESSGIDNINFYLSANIGLKPKLLDQVASGGELSRLLLALKEALPSSGEDVFIVFDEIDTGVSGRIAELIGKKLTVLSRNSQLMAITHLPQIAGLADNHVKVEKKLVSNGTEAAITNLSPDQRLDEIASLLSGGKITEAAIRQAQNMLSLN